MELILKYTLKKIQEEMTSIPFLNRGGCCHFAKLLAKQLEKRNISFKVVICENWININSIKTAIVQKSDEIWGGQHIMLKINNYFVDSENFSKKYPINNIEKYKCFYLNSKHLTTYSVKGTWNYAFNKRKYHPIINKIILNKFEIYDKLKKQ